MWNVDISKSEKLWSSLIKRFNRQQLSRVKGMLSNLASSHPINASPDQRQKVENIWFPHLPSQPWCEPGALLWSSILEKNFKVFQSSLEMVLSDESLLHSYETRNNLGQGWKAFSFMRDGVWQLEACLKHPSIVRVLDTLPLYPGDIMFSLLEGDTFIPPHFGLSNLKLTMHLGMKVPTGCSICVDKETGYWEQGLTLVFDDSFIHSVDNPTNQRRIIFLVDVWHPNLSNAEVAALRYLLPKLRRSLY